MKFTDKYISNLKPKEKMYQVRESKGFGVRVLPSGHKIWIFIYTFDGKRRQMNLGSYPATSLADASSKHAAAYSILHDRLNPRDPQEERDKKLNAERLAREEHRLAPTVSKLITEYITKHAKSSKKTWKDDERILNKDALVAWGNRKAVDIRKRDVVLLLESIVDRGSPGSANNNFKIIRKMFRFAVERDILEHSPCDGVKMPAPIRHGDRVLSESEIKAFWNNLDTCHSSDGVRRAIKLILVTGQRPGEVLGIHTDEIDESGRWWTIPVERSKNKKSHRVYLTDMSLELIGPLKVLDEKSGKLKPKGFIFQSPNPKGKVTTETGEITRKIQPLWRQAAAKVIYRNLASPVILKGKPVFTEKGEPVTENLLGVAEFTPHDLRRTAATFISQLGFMDEVIDAVLNHVKQGIIRTYNLNRYDKEKQQALEAWERKLNSIIKGSECNVIPIKRKAA